jgi:hypothetical protein
MSNNRKGEFYLKSYDELKVIVYDYFKKVGFEDISTNRDIQGNAIRIFSDNVLYFFSNSYGMRWLMSAHASGHKEIENEATRYFKELLTNTKEDWDNFYGKHTDLEKLEISFLELKAVIYNTFPQLYDKIIIPDNCYSIMVYPYDDNNDIYLEFGYSPLMGGWYWDDATFSGLYDVTIIKEKYKEIKKRTKVAKDFNYDRPLKVFLIDFNSSEIRL